MAPFRCACGDDLIVKNVGDRSVLLCMFHDSEDGCFFGLPTEKPDDWDEWTLEKLTDFLAATFKSFS